MPSTFMHLISPQTLGGRNHYHFHFLSWWNQSLEMVTNTWQITGQIQDQTHNFLEQIRAPVKNHLPLRGQIYAQRQFLNFVHTQATLLQISSLST